MFPIFFKSKSDIRIVGLSTTHRRGFVDLSLLLILPYFVG